MRGRGKHDVQSLQHHHQPSPYQRAVPRSQPLRRQPGADAGRLSRLQCADRSDRTRRPRTRDRPLGHALVGARAHGGDQEAHREAGGQGQDRRFQGIAPDGAGLRDDQHPEREVKHWTRWLGPEHRCLVPFNSFSEFNKAEGGDIWFALDETRPLLCFAGIWTNWTSVRKVRDGETTNDLYAFLTTEPNAEVGAIHPKAMPVILTTSEEVETWMTAPAGGSPEAAAAASR